MIYVDARAGSNDVGASLEKAGLPVAYRDRQATDIMFEGRGFGGDPFQIGIEHKNLDDLITSLRTNRLSAVQLKPLRDACRYCYLIVEGPFLYDEAGQLLEYKSRKEFRRVGMTVGECEKRLHVLELCGGLRWQWERTRKDTIAFITTLYRTVTDKDLDEHTSILTDYDPPEFKPLNDFQRVIRKLPGVGARIGQGAQGSFRSIRRAINASPAEWAAIKSTDPKTGRERAFGLSHAQRLVELVRKEWS